MQELIAVKELLHNLGLIGKVDGELFSFCLQILHVLRDLVAIQSEGPEFFVLTRYGLIVVFLGCNLRFQLLNQVQVLLKSRGNLVVPDPVAVVREHFDCFPLSTFDLLSATGNGQSLPTDILFYQLVSLHLKLLSEAFSFIIRIEHRNCTFLALCCFCDQVVTCLSSVVVEDCLVPSAEGKTHVCFLGR